LHREARQTIRYSLGWKGGKDDPRCSSSERPVRVEEKAGEQSRSGRKAAYFRMSEEWDFAIWVFTGWLVREQPVLVLFPLYPAGRSSFSFLFFFLFFFSFIPGYPFVRLPSAKSHLSSTVQGQECGGGTEIKFIGTEVSHDTCQEHTLPQFVTRNIPMGQFAS